MEQGISTVSESGVQTISNAIKDQILKFSSSSFSEFKNSTWGLGYDSDNAYLVWTIQKTTDTIAQICYRYSTLTNSWTTFDKTNTCGIIHVTDDKLYLGAGDTNYIEQERKNFNRLDYADREISSALNNNKYFQTTIYLDDVSEISTGDSLVQEQKVSITDFNLILNKLDLDPSIITKNYFSTLEAEAGDNLRTKLEDLAQKLDSDTDVNQTDYYSTIQSKTGTITANTAANPTVITSVSHGLFSGRIVEITGSNSTPSIDGVYEVTVIDADTFSIPVSVITPGTTGTFTTDINDFDDMRSCHNKIISKLNTDSGVSFSNYPQSDNDVLLESVITNVNIFTKQITVNIALDYIQGPLIIFKAIKSTFTYSPNVMGDSLGLKHAREATMMFKNKAFTSATTSFATDLLPQFIDVEFNGDGNGIFGASNFGSGFFGGGANSAPFRTYIPRQCQRCRYMVVKFTHQIARESFAVFGTTLTAEVGQSTRSYR